jgi:hypothetical protein
MKSTLLKTLAATSLVVTTHAEIQVLGASFKERGVYAPLGTIDPNPGTVQATRGYLIIDDTVTTTSPNKATYVEYWEEREAGVVNRLYTIDSDFTAFKADSILGASGGRRLYGHMLAPSTLVSEVANPMIPFSGTQFADPAFPRKLSFDQTTFQNGNSDAATGPQIVMADSKTLRSVVSGSANPVRVSAITIPTATDELVARLFRQGYTREVAEVPTIVDDLDPTLTLQDGQQSTLTVVVGSDSIPGPIPGTNPVEFDNFAAPTFQWLKDDVAIPGAVGASYVVTGGPSTATNGIGSYKVVVTNTVGSTTSVTTVVSTVATALAALPASQTLFAASSFTLETTLTPTPIATPTYQWLKSPSGTAGTFVNVSAAFGGNDPKLVVIGGETAPVGSVATGAGFYRLDVTTSAGLVSSTVSNITVTTAPGTNFVFTTNSPRTLSVALSGTAKISPIINASAVPSPTLATRRWYKAPLNTTNFV